jgi:hypothetical protein
MKKAYYLKDSKQLKEPVHELIIWVYRYVSQNKVHVELSSDFKKLGAQYMWTN